MRKFWYESEKQNQLKEKFLWNNSCLSALMLNDMAILEKYVLKLAQLENYLTLLSKSLLVSSYQFGGTHISRTSLISQTVYRWVTWQSLISWTGVREFTDGSHFYEFGTHFSIQNEGRYVKTLSHVISKYLPVQISYSSLQITSKRHQASSSWEIIIIIIFLIFRCLYLMAKYIYTRIFIFAYI